jgi:colanic acid biosynthesis glycosyl transferase WcaI
MRLQLWSCNYEPEPTGVAPVSTSLARMLLQRGWDVDVVAAHPHYPEPVWGHRAKPYRENRAGVRLLRLPLWPGRRTAGQRLRQEASYAAALLATLPALGPPVFPRPDMLLVTSPAFAGLLPAIINRRVRGVPLILWLHDILPDGAAASGVLEDGGVVLRASRRLEHSAYSASDRIVVLSAPFRENLISKGVPDEKIELIYDPATRGVPREPAAIDPSRRGARILSIGNIGRTQGLAPLIRAFEASEAMMRLGVRLIITGSGVAAAEAWHEVRSDRVEMLGVVSDERLERELKSASLALVSQSYTGTEFNLPSKLMNFMAYGLPIVAAVNPTSETARLVREAGAGWIADSSRPESFPAMVERALADLPSLRERGSAGRAYAERKFSPRTFVDSFESVLRKAAHATTRAESLS